MGLFSSEYRTTVGTQVSRVIADKSLPNAVKTGTISAILAPGQDSSIPDYIMDELVFGLGAKAERLYKYGAGDYIYGLPSGQYTSQSKGRAEAQAILDAQHTSPVLIEYCNLGPPNDLHIGWTRLIQDYGWNPTTNELPVLSAQEGVPVYLHNLEVVIPTALASSFPDGVLDAWGPPATAGWTPTRNISSAAAGALRAPSPVVLENAAASDYVRVTAIWQKTVEVSGPESSYGQVITFTGTHTIAVTGFDSNADYFHVRYVVDDQVHFWMYRCGEGTYPTLDALFETPFETNGTYFPFIYLRFNKQNGAADPASQDYLSSRRITKYLGMDYDTVCEAVDSNPDIGAVEQALVMFAVPANTANQMELRYLFDYLDRLYLSQENTFQLASQAQTYSTFANDPNVNRHTIIIQDKRFKMALSHTGLFKRRRGGSIGAVGTHTMSTGSTPYDDTYTDSETGLSVQVQRDLKYHVYRRQITAGLYEEITVNQLQMLYRVLDGYYSTADETDDILLIPLDRSITQDYSITDREELYSRSLHYVFNSAQVTEIAWYQTGFFQLVMLVVAIVIAVKTGQFEHIGAALAGSTAAAMTLLTNLLIGLAISYGMKLFVKAVGGELGMLLAVVAAAMAMYKGFEFGSLKGAPWADELLFLSNGLSKAVTSFYAEEMRHLLQDYSSMLDYQKQLTDELNTAQKLLEGDNIMSPFVIFGEKPEDFFNRTVHSGNIGILGIQAISNYVDNALKLPELHESITA